MEQMTCPQCPGTMNRHRRGGVEIVQCEACGGVFLDRAQLADLIEQENEWHLSSAHETQPLPRITPDMSPPPEGLSRSRSESYIDELFG